MADSQQFRKKFYTSSIVFLAICLAIVVFVYALSDPLSSGKLDLTADGIYTVSESTEEIIEGLVDKVVVDYYVSQKDLPGFIERILRDTRDMFEEFRELSGGKFEYHIVDPNELATEEAQKKVQEYYAAKEAGEDPEEPEPVQSIQDIFSGRPAPKGEEIRAERQKRAAEFAAQQGRDKDEIFRELLAEEFERQFKDKLEQDGIGAFPVQEREAASVRQLRVYSAIKISYLDKQPEVIPVHYQIENLEYELMSRILKLTADNKPVVAVFDARKPEAPPFDPRNPMSQRPPQSDYDGIIGALQDLFDIRSIALEEGDSIDDLVATLKEEKWERENPDASEEEKSEKLDKTVRPEDLKLVEALVIAQPDALEARQVYEINRAVSLGVDSIFLVSRHSLDASQQGMQQGFPIATLSPGAAFEDMLKEWGVEIPGELVASNDCGIVTVFRRMGPLQIPQPTPVAICVASTRAQLSDESALTSRLSHIIFPASTGLKVVTGTLEKAGLQHEVLAKSSEKSWRVKIDPFRNMNNPLARGQGVTLAQYQDDLVQPKDENYLSYVDSPVPLGVFLTGKFPFKFQGEPIPEWEKKPETDDSSPSLPGGLPLGHPPTGDGDRVENASDPELVAMAQEGDAESSTDGDAPKPAPVGGAETSAQDSTPAPESTPEAVPAPESEPPPPPAPTASLSPVDGRVLVLASADMMKTSFLSQGRGEYQPNVNFFYNAVEQLALDNKLMNIRSKQLTVREFKPGSEKHYKYILWLNIVIVPFVVGVVGACILGHRRRQSVAYERDYLAKHSGR